MKRVTLLECKAVARTPYGFSESAWGSFLMRRRGAREPEGSWALRLVNITEIGPRSSQSLSNGGGKVPPEPSAKAKPRGTLCFLVSRLCTAIAGPPPANC